LIFRRILYLTTECASYRIVGAGKNVLAVGDAHAEHLGDYRGVAARSGAPSVVIEETHVQEDHRSCSPARAARSRAAMCLHEAGDELPLGNDDIRVPQSPGHSPDSVTLLVGDRLRGDYRADVTYG